MSKVVTPSMAQPAQKIPHDKIQMRAYEKWLKKGRPHGSDVQNWLEAEAELKAEIARGAACATNPAQPQRR